MAERAPPQATLPLRNLGSPCTLPNRWTWARGWTTSPKGGVSSRPPPNPTLSQPVTEERKQHTVTATRKTARLKTPELKPTAAPKSATGKHKKKAVAIVKTASCQAHITETGGIHSISHIATRGNLWSRPPSPRSIFGGDSSAAHFHLFPHQRGSPPANFPEERYPVRRWRIWLHALGGRSGVKPYTSPAGMRTECAAGSLNSNISSTSTVSMLVL